MATHPSLARAVARLAAVSLKLMASRIFYNITKWLERPASKRHVARVYLALLSLCPMFASANLWLNGYHSISVVPILAAVLLSWSSFRFIYQFRPRAPGPKVILSQESVSYRPRGLVLCGGGGKGAYQLGVLRAFREQGIKFDVVAGSSVGALNAALCISIGLDSAREVFFDNVAHVLRFSWKTPFIALLRFYAYKARHVIVKPQGRIYRALGFVFGALSIIFLILGYIESPLPDTLITWFFFYHLTYWGLTFAPYFLSIGLWLAAEHWNWVAFSERSLSALIKTYIKTAPLTNGGVRLFVCVSRLTDLSIPRFISDWPGRLYSPHYIEITQAKHNINR